MISRILAIGGVAAMLLCGQEAPELIITPAEPGVNLVPPYNEIKTYLALTNCSRARGD